MFFGGEVRFTTRLDMAGLQSDAAKAAQSLQGIDLKVKADFGDSFKDCGAFRDCLQAATKEVGELQRAMQSANRETIRVKVDRSELKEAVGLVRELRGTGTTTVRVQQGGSDRGGRQQTEQAVERGVARAIATEFQETRKTIKDSAPQSGGLLGAITAPLRGAVRGASEGLGFSLAQEIGKGVLGGGLDKRLQQVGKEAEKYVTVRSRQIGEAVAETLGYRQGLQDVARDIRAVGTAVDAFLDPKKLSERIGNLENGLVDALDALAVKGDRKEAADKLADAVAPAGELAEEIGRRVTAATIKAVAQPFRIRKKVLLRRSGEIAEAIAQQIDVPDLQSEKRGVILATGGVPLEREEREGRNTTLIQQSLRQTFPESQVVPIRNPWSSDPATMGKLFEMRDRLLNAVLESGLLSEAEVKALVVQKDDKERSIFDPLNIEKMMQTGLETGFNIDAIILDAYRRAYEAKFPELKGAITFFGNSFGSAIVEEATAIAERAGADIKGIGMLFPQLGIANTASAENFRAIVGSLDHTALQIFGADPNVLRPEEMTKRNRKLFERTIKSARDSGFDPGMLRGIFSPTSATQVFPNAGFAHNFARAIANPEVNASIREFTGDRLGQVPEGALGELGERMGGYLFDLYLELESLDRSFRVALGQADALQEVAEGRYSFLDPNTLEQRKAFGPEQILTDLESALAFNLSPDIAGLEGKFGTEAAAGFRKLSEDVGESLIDLMIEVDRFRETGVRDLEALSAIYSRFSRLTGISDRPTTTPETLQNSAIEQFELGIKQSTSAIEEAVKIAEARPLLDLGGVVDVVGEAEDLKARLLREVKEGGEFYAKDIRKLGKALGLSRSQTTGGRARAVEGLFDNFSPGEIRTQLDAMRGEFNVPAGLRGVQGGVRPMLDANVVGLLSENLGEFRAAIQELDVDTQEQAVRAAETIRTRVENQIEGIARLRKDFRIEGNVNQQIQGYLSQIEAVAERVGRFLNEGIAVGVEGSQPLAIGSARETGQALIAELEDVLEIRSPSKVGERIGRFFGEGFEIGLQALRTGTERAGGLLGELKSKGLAEGQAFLRDFGQEARTASPGLDRLLQGLSGLRPILRDIATTAVAGFGLFSIGDAVAEAGIRGFQAALNFERLKLSLSFSTGENPVAIFSELREDSERLGDNLQAATRSYQRLVSALQDTPLEFSSDRIFDGIREGAAVRGLRGEDLQEVFRQVGQIGAGPVLREDLNVIDDRFPGFLAQLNTALGTTNSELRELTRNGQLLGEEVLPLVADQLSRQAQSGLQDLQDSPITRQAQLQNEADELQRNLGAGTLELANTAMPALTAALSLVNDNLEILQAIAGVAAVALGVTLVKAAVGLTAALTGTIPAIRLFRIAGVGLVSLTRAALSAAPALVAISAGMELFQLGNDDARASTNRLTAALEKLEEQSEATQDSLSGSRFRVGGTLGFLDRAFSEGANALVTAGELISSSPAELAAGERARSVVGERFRNRRAQGPIAALDLRLQEGDLRDTAAALKAVNDANAVRLLDPDNLARARAELSGIASQISNLTIQASRARLDGDTELSETLQGQIDELQQARGDVRSELLQGEEEARAALQEATQRLKDLEGLRAGIDANVYAELFSKFNLELKQAERQVQNVADAVKEISTNLRQATSELRKANLTAAVTRERLSDRAISQSLDVRRAQLAGEIDDDEATRRQSSIQEAELRGVQQALRENIRQFGKTFNETFTEQVRADVRAALGATEGQNLADVTLAELQDALDNTDGLNTESEQLLGALVERKELEREIRDLQGQVLDVQLERQESEKQAAEALQEFNEQYAEYFQSVRDRIEDLTLELEQQRLELEREILGNDIRAAMLGLEGPLTGIAELIETTTDFVSNSQRRAELQIRQSQLSAERELRDLEQQGRELRRGRPAARSAPDTGATPDNRLLQRLVLAESSGEGPVGMAAVARAIFNRLALVQSGTVTPGTYLARGNSLEDIMRAPGQFQPFSDGRINLPFSEAQFAQASEAITLALDTPELRRALVELVGEARAEAIIDSTGFRTHEAFDDPSQNHNVASLGNHRFNSDQFAKKVDVSQIFDRQGFEFSQPSDAGVLVAQAGGGFPVIDGPERLQFGPPTGQFGGLQQQLDLEVQGIREQQRSEAISAAEQAVSVTNQVRDLLEDAESSLMDAQEGLIDLGQAEVDGTARDRARRFADIEEAAGDRLENLENALKQIEVATSPENVQNLLANADVAAALGEREVSEALRDRAAALQTQRGELEKAIAAEKEFTASVGQTQERVQNRVRQAAESNLEDLGLGNEIRSAELADDPRLRIRLEHQQRLLEIDRNRKRELEEINRRLADEPALLAQTIAAKERQYALERDISRERERQEQRAFSLGAQLEDTFPEYAIQGINGIGEALQNAGSILDGLRDTAIELLTSVLRLTLTKGLSSLFNVAPSFSSGALSVGNFATGAKAIVPFVPNLNNGSKALALGLGMQAAMSREGSDAMPAVLHRNEAVLSARPGFQDAQLYRDLVQSGYWDDMKAQWKANRQGTAQYVPNYNVGALAAGGDRMRRAPVPSSPTTTNNDNRTNVELHIHSRDVSSSRADSRQVASRLAREIQRANPRSKRSQR